ncbi:unnamed protein product [Owenia fusiformis]|uniref:Uncharacterized protein n=1 Tax=Owenia fusiformis TaxID=6347 RepID=A0A8S4PIS5_OWEFU|nr:unnamed protein product [Owenia fusiformis]
MDHPYNLLDSTKDYDDAAVHNVDELLGEWQGTIGAIEEVNPLTKKICFDVHNCYPDLSRSGDETSKSSTELSWPFLPEDKTAGSKKRKDPSPNSKRKAMEVHRDCERQRHQSLNERVQQLSETIPGYDPYKKETKIQQLEKIINYILFLESDVLSLCKELGLTCNFQHMLLTPHISNSNLSESVTTFTATSVDNTTTHNKGANLHHKSDSTMHNWNTTQHSQDTTKHKQKHTSHNLEFGSLDPTTLDDTKECKFMLSPIKAAKMPHGQPVYSRSANGTSNDVKYLGKHTVHEIDGHKCVAVPGAKHKKVFLKAMPLTRNRPVDDGNSEGLTISTSQISKNVSSDSDRRMTSITLRHLLSEGTNSANHRYIHNKYQVSGPITASTDWCDDSHQDSHSSTNWCESSQQSSQSTVIEPINWCGTGIDFPIEHGDNTDGEIKTKETTTEGQVPDIIVADGQAPDEQAVPELEFIIADEQSGDHHVRTGIPPTDTTDTDPGHGAEHLGPKLTTYEKAMKRSWDCYSHEVNPPQKKQDTTLSPESMSKLFKAIDAQQNKANVQQNKLDIQQSKPGSQQSKVESPHNELDCQENNTEGKQNNFEIQQNKLECQASNLKDQQNRSEQASVTKINNNEVGKSLSTAHTVCTQNKDQIVPAKCSTIGGAISPHGASRRKQSIPMRSPTSVQISPMKSPLTSTSQNGWKQVKKSTGQTVIKSHMKSPQAKSPPTMSKDYKSPNKRVQIPVKKSFIRVRKFTPVKARPSDKKSPLRSPLSTISNMSPTSSGSDNLVKPHWSPRVYTIGKNKLTCIPYGWCQYGGVVPKIQQPITHKAAMKLESSDFNTVIEEQERQQDESQENSVPMVTRVDHRKTSWMNGFMMFSRLNRTRFVQENPGVHTSIISRIMGQAWRSMTTTDQQPYKDKAKVYTKYLQKVHHNGAHQSAVAAPGMLQPHVPDLQAKATEHQLNIPVNQINQVLDNRSNNQPSALDNQSTVLNNQPSALNNQPSTLNNQPSALNNQPSALDNQSSILDNQPTYVKDKTDSQTSNIKAKQ